jgi:protein TonB
MFVDSVSDVPWTDRSRRGYATLISFTLESLVVGGLLLMPILYVQGLPHAQWVGALVLPAPPPAPPPTGMRAQPARPSASELTSDGRIIVPSEIPDHVAQITDASAPAPVDISQLGVQGGTGDRMTRSTVFGSTGSELSTIVPPPPQVAAKPLRISQVMEGYIIHRVQPEYPSLARQVHIQGSVVLRALISREGKIENLQVISGHPMLAPAAIEAVRQWRYRPYYLNNEPVEVETQVTVNFTLAGG